jgi:hypothetical protein
MASFYRAAVLGLTVDERKAILAALETPPPSLENLRAILTPGHGVAAMRERLATS